MPKKKGAKHACSCPKNTCFCQSPNPPIIKQLSHDFQTGTCITVYGYVKTNCSTFVVNLMCDTNRKSDIALHFNPRICQKYVVRNSRIDGHWGEAEATSMGRFDFVKGKNFELCIYAANREFFIALNGKHFCAFVYRIPIGFVKVIAVEGMVQVDDIKYENIQFYPPTTPNSVAMSLPLGGTLGNPNDNSTPMETPLTTALPLSMPFGYELNIRGYFKLISRTFFVSLQDGVQVWPYPDVYLHIKSIMSTTFDRQTLVNNNRSDGVWGKEERTIAQRFLPAGVFNLAIQKLEDCFLISIDDINVADFKFRGNVERINTVYIQGDVFIYSLSLNKMRKDSL